MSKIDTLFQKISATPTLFAWSQAYNAGGLFTVISLSKSSEEQGSTETLSTVGKDILDRLEKEYFTLEEKTLESIKPVIETSLEIAPQDITITIAVCSLVDDVLYVYARGGAQIQMIRNGKMGTLLSSDYGDSMLLSGSGVLQTEDLIVLKTWQFSQIIPDEQLKTVYLEQPFETASDNITPLVLGEQKGDACAIIIQCREKASTEIPVAQQLASEQLEQVQSEELQPTQTPSESIEMVSDGELINPVVFEEEPQQENVNEALSQEKTEEIKPTILEAMTSLFSGLKLPIGAGRTIRFNRSKRTALLIFILLLIILSFGIYASLKRENDKKIQSQFEAVFPDAQKNYDEGVALESLNKNLARDDFAKAQKILDDNKDKFPKDSTQEKQILDLLSKVNTELNQASAAFSVNPVETGSGKSILLDTSLSKNASYVTQDDKTVYYANSLGITSLDKQTKKEKLIIKKDWGTLSGLSVYIGNVYLVDSSASQIFKYVATDGDFVKQNYLAQSSDVSSAISIAIDGSLWTLLKNGTVLKFTKGKPDSYNTSGLDKPFSNPTRIYTNADSDNYYVLDNQNQRIVTMNKDKGYVNQYVSPLLKPAKEFDVFEKDKIIYFLSSGKIYSFNL